MSSLPGIFGDPASDRLNQSGF